MKHAEFVFNRLKEKPAIAWTINHLFAIIVVSALIIGLYLALPFIMSIPSMLLKSPASVVNASSNPYETYCQIGHVYINIVISDDGVTYLNNEYKVSVYLGDLGITDDLKGPYLDLPAIDSTINITAVPYDNNYVTLTKSMKIGCVSDVHISMRPIKKDPSWRDKEAVVVTGTDSTIAVIDYNKDVYYVN